MNYNKEDIEFKDVVFNGLALGTIYSIAFIGTRYRVCKLSTRSISYCS